jgi:hypothetical protein
MLTFSATFDIIIDVTYSLPQSISNMVLSLVTPDLPTYVAAYFQTHIAKECPCFKNLLQKYACAKPFAFLPKFYQ